MKKVFSIGFILIFIASLSGCQIENVKNAEEDLENLPHEFYKGMITTVDMATIDDLMGLLLAFKTDDGETLKFSLAGMDKKVIGVEQWWDINGGDIVEIECVGARNEDSEYLRVVTIEVIQRCYTGIVTEMVWNENNSCQINVTPNDGYNEIALSFSADTTIPITGLDKIDDIEVGDAITVIYENNNVAIDLSNIQIVRIEVLREMPW